MPLKVLVMGRLVTKPQLADGRSPGPIDPADSRGSSEPELAGVWAVELPENVTCDTGCKLASREGIQGPGVLPLPVLLGKDRVA